MSESIRERVNRLSRNDDTNCRDAEVFRSKFGEYPIGWQKPGRGRKLMAHQPVSGIAPNPAPKALEKTKQRGQ